MKGTVRHLDDWRRGAALALMLAIVLSPILLSAQEPVARPLDSLPFDQIVLDAANQNRVLDVFPLELPNRRVPNPRPTGKLDIRLLNRPGYVYQVSWSSIAEVRLYEEILQNKAVEHVDNGEFDDAFDYFTRLLADYPDTPNLAQQIDRYLQQNALALYRSGDFDRALALLGTLYDRSPGHPGLSGAVDTVASKIIRARLAAEDYSGARAVLEMLRNQFGPISAVATRNWEQRFAQAADKQLTDARALFDAGQFVAAQRAAYHAATIWPEASATEELLQDIARAYPQVIVGVYEQALAEPCRQLDCRAARRVASLTELPVAYLSGFGAEGGIYESPFGTLQIDETGARLTIAPRAPSPLVMHDVARFLLQVANSSTDHLLPELATHCKSITVDDAGEVHLDLRKPHVRPEALLQAAVSKNVVEHALAGGAIETIPYESHVDTETQVRFEKPGGSNARSVGPQSIVERKFTSDEVAATALIRGDIHVLERAAPWQISRLKAAGMQIGRYRLPTLHVLLLDHSHPLLARREFRRGLCFGIDRQRIVQRIVTGGEEQPGFQVISGPMPPGTSLSDPLRYAYDANVVPRDYEPRLAATLMLVAASSVAKLQAEQAAAAARQTDSAAPPPAPPEVGIPELVLAHSADPLARAVCDAIGRQLRPLGIPLKVQEVTTAELLDPDSGFHLRYAELAMWEPLVDAQQLLGDDGIAGSTSAAMRAALRELQHATNWNEVREQCHEVHRIAHNDLPVIPLWQTVNHFAHNGHVEGISEPLIRLYQNAHRWRLTPGGAR